MGKLLVNKVKKQMSKNIFLRFKSKQIKKFKNMLIWGYIFYYFPKVFQL